MKNLIEIIKSAYSEEKPCAEYLLQLNKIVELENKFTKEFEKDKWKGYFELEIEKGQLRIIEIDHIIEFIIKFLRNLNG